MWEKDARQYETPPTHPSGMKMSDAQLAVRTDAAILKDRIAAAYRLYWDSVSLDWMAAHLGVARNQVKAVALDLNVYG